MNPTTDPLSSILQTASDVGSNIINAWGAAQVAQYSAQTTATQPAPVYAMPAQVGGMNTSTLLIVGAVVLAGVVLVARAK